MAMLLDRLKAVLAQFRVRTPDEMALDSPSVIGGQCESPERIRFDDYGRVFVPPAPRPARRTIDSDPA